MSEEEIQKSAASQESVRLSELVADYENQINEIADLVSRVRHEINNPLTGVLGQAQLLLREELNDKARKRAEIIEQLARRLTDIVAELRLVQRPPKAAGANQAPSTSS
jgi:signal transduction histidine kinase